MSLSILIVDDELEVCLSLGELLDSRGYRTWYETDPLGVPAAVTRERPDCILMDIRMPGTDGIELLEALNARASGVPVIMISGNPTVDDAVRAMRFGAANVFAKPIEIDDLIKEIDRLAPEPGRHIDRSEIITRDPKMTKVLQEAARAAPTEATVLVTGESGTGKELVARLIHRRSNRSSRPFLVVNCAAIPDTLLESEIFGHERGAFTDAVEARPGIFERAADGTVFLDEIGDMSPRTQAKMLRVIQDGRFSRVGGSEEVVSMCRIIAATNRDLQELISSGDFREDLYYRLTVIHHHLPPLRERPADILPIAEHYLQTFAAEYGKSLEGLDGDVERLLTAHNWPGNVRELRNVIQRAVIFSTQNVVRAGDLPDQYCFVSVPEGDLATKYDERARDVILEALRRSGGKRGDAARILKIDRKTLYNRMRKLKIDP